MGKLNWKRIVLLAIIAELLIIYFSDLQEAAKDRAAREARLRQLPVESPAVQVKGQG